MQMPFVVREASAAEFVRPDVQRSRQVLHDLENVLMFLLCPEVPSRLAQGLTKKQMFVIIHWYPLKHINLLLHHALGQH